MWDPIFLTFCRSWLITIKRYGVPSCGTPPYSVFRRSGSITVRRYGVPSGGTPHFSFASCSGSIAIKKCRVPPCGTHPLFQHSWFFVFHCTQKVRGPSCGIPPSSLFPLLIDCNQKIRGPTMWDSTFFIFSVLDWLYSKDTGSHMLVNFSAFWIDCKQKIRGPSMWDPTFLTFCRFWLITIKR